MGEGQLTPEARFELRIHLDRLKAAEERCRDGLYDLSNGRLTREAYIQLLREQSRAQRDWEQKQRSYFPPEV